VKALQAGALRGNPHLYLGILYKQRKDLDRAEMHLKASAAANPRDVTPHLHLLEVYYAAGLKERALEEGEILSGRMSQDDDLFRQTMDLVLIKGSAGDVQLSPDIILHVLHQAMREKADLFKSQLAYLEKVLDKDSKTE
jgi:tetratricopeptide (TPR) repeat protein